jgi:AcrR family transcriptional regulator
MPQILKDDIKQRISEAAFKHFATFGFKNTSMAHIAKDANVSVGNIYRYYVNKDDIFYSLITPQFVNKFKQTMQIRVNKSGTKFFNVLKRKAPAEIIDQDVIDFYFEYRLHIVILLDNSKDTVYENIRRELKDMAFEYIQKYFQENIAPQYNLDQEKRFLLDIIYENLVYGILKILKEYTDKEDIERAYKSLIGYHLYGLLGIWETPDYISKS